MINQTVKMTLALALAMGLAACGGGGGGNNNNNNTSASTPTPTPAATPTPAPAQPAAPVVVAPPPYTLTPSTVTASYVAGYPTTISLTAKQTVAFVGVVYVTVAADADVIDPGVTITQQADGSLGVQMKTSTTAKPGVYSGNFTVNVCNDPNCTTQLAGAPFKLPYSIEVFSPDGALDAYTESPLAALAGAADWGTFQANAQHTGYVPVTLNPGAFTPRWRITAPAANGTQIVLSTVATGGGRLYVTNGTSFGSTNASLTAYSETDGTKVWSHSFQDLTYPSTNAPAYANGRVFTSAGSQQSTAMFGFDAASGSQLFKMPMTSQWESYLAPTVFNENVYTDGGTYGGLYSFSALTGTQNYFVSLDQYDGWTPAFDSQNMYTYMAGKLRVQDPLTGAVLATISDPLYSWNGYTTNGAPVVGGGGIVYAGNLSNPAANGIVAFDTVNKSVRWSASGGFAGNPAYADGYLFAANNATGKMEVRRESDGGIEWSWPSPDSGSTFSSDVLVTKNLVFVSTSMATYAIDRGTHATVWSYKGAGKLALSANGVLYIKAPSRIYAINLQ
jgi:outer membrane protein assembly factor BamB